MNNIRRRVVSLVLSLVLALGLCGTAFAAEATGPLGLTITANDGTFTYDKVSVTNPDEDVTYDAYSAYGIFTEGTNLSSVQLNFSTTATSLKVNDTAVTLSGGSGSAVVDLDDKTIEVEVSNAAETHICYVSGYCEGDTITATVVIDYENARTFAQTEVGGTYGNYEGLDPVSEEQKSKATAAVAALDAKLPTVADRTMTFSTLNPATSNAKTILESMAAAKSLTITGTTSYVQEIEGLGEESTGMFYEMMGTGGWMYSVVRNGKTLSPNVAATLWKLQPGDVIQWRYTCDWGADLALNIWG